MKQTRQGFAGLLASMAPGVAIALVPFLIVLSSSV
jgi:hypothetical protein